MHQCLQMNGKGSSDYFMLHKNIGDKKKKNHHSVRKFTPEKSVAYFDIQLYNVWQKKKLKIPAEQAAGGVNYNYHWKAKAQHYTILTHAGLPLQSNKDLAPCMLVYEPLKIPRQKWGDKEYSRSSTPKTGGPKLGQY